MPLIEALCTIPTMNLFELLKQASSSVESSSNQLSGGLGALDSHLVNYGSFTLTLGVLALLNPRIELRKSVPFADFPGANETLAIDCFHVDLIHNDKIEDIDDSIYFAIGNSLAKSWNGVLSESGDEGKFSYDPTSRSVIYGT